MSDALDFRLQVFMLILVRVSTVFVSLPALTQHGIPPRTRIGLAALLSFLVAPVAKTSFVNPLAQERLIFAVLSEAGVGFFIGLILSTGFEAVSIALRVIETQAGFSLGSSIMGTGGAPQSALGAFYSASAVVIFFASGAFREMLRGLASTFDGLSVGSLAFAERIEPSILVWAAARMFVSALHFGAPIVAAILLADLALGLLSRAAPQMSVFAIGFPIKIGVALALAAASFPLFAASFPQHMRLLMRHLFGAS